MQNNILHKINVMAQYLVGPIGPFLLIEWTNVYRFEEDNDKTLKMI